MNYKLSPSILAADVANLGNELKVVTQAGAEYIHIDVMDGNFVPTISFGVPVVKGLRDQVDAFFDVHLMVNEPLHLIKEFVEAGADGITVHIEACEDIESTLDAIAEAGAKVGISINPNTKIERLYPYLDKVDMVLVMTVLPGYGGQKLLRSTLKKIKDLRHYIKKKGYDIDIEVDGGINLENVHSVLEAGANIIVAGTKVFEGNKVENINAFRQEFAKRKGEMK